MNTVHPAGRERRYFPRISFDSHGTLLTTRRRWRVRIVDLSFNGALAASIHKHNLETGEEVVLTIEREQGQPIKMQGRLRYQRDHLLGIECRASGIDNQMQLRELLEKYKESGRGH